MQPTTAGLTPNNKETKKADFDINDYEGLSVNQLEQMIANRKKELQQLESLLETKKQESNLCVICLEEIRNTVCVPCGHLAYCNICVEGLQRKGFNTCSVCRNPVTTYTRVFFV